MTFLIEKLKFLGLNDREVRVFTALATFGQMNMTDTASRSGLPRTTVDAIVRRLMNQGLVMDVQVGGHSEYFVSAEELADTLDWIEKRFRPNTGAFFNEYQNDEPTFQTENDEKIVIDKEYLDDIKNFAKKYDGDRVQMLLARGHGDMNACIDRFIKYAEIAITHNFKFEVMLASTIADAIVERRENIPLPEKSEYIRLNVVPARYSDATHDMFVFRDALYVLHVNSGERDSIVHKTVVETGKHLIEIASETGWSVDLKTWVNRE
jgi:predicted DNA-binding transcriptional regulator